MREARPWGTGVVGTGGGASGERMRVEIRRYRVALGVYPKYTRSYHGDEVDLKRICG